MLEVTGFSITANADGKSLAVGLTHVVTLSDVAVSLRTLVIDYGISIMNTDAGLSYTNPTTAPIFYPALPLLGHVLSVGVHTATYVVTYTDWATGLTHQAQATTTFNVTEASPVNIFPTVLLVGLLAALGIVGIYYAHKKG
jgi:hypothetical protein